MTPKQEEPSDDKLAALLREFGETAAEESRLAGLERERLIDTIAEAVRNPPDAVLRRPGISAIERVAYALASCAVLVLAVGYWFSLQKENVVVVPPQEQSFAEKYQGLMQVAFEHEAILGQPLAWFAEQGNDIQFALLPQHSADRSSRVVFAELTFEKLQPDAAAPTSETCFLMIRDEQPLELFGKEDSTLQLLFWLCPVEENLYAYELAVAGQSGGKLVASTAGLIEPETVITPLDVKKDRDEYRVFLRVHPI